MRKYAGAGAGERVAYWKKGVRHAWRTQAPRPAAWRVSGKRGTPRIRNAEATWRAGNAERTTYATRGVLKGRGAPRPGTWRCSPPRPKQAWRVEAPRRPRYATP